MFYIYDGTWEGMMCLVFATARDGAFPQGIFRNEGEGRSIFENTLIKTDPMIAGATFESLRRRLPARALQDAGYALLSEARWIDMAVWSFLESLWKEGGSAGWDLKDPYAFTVFEASRLAQREFARWMGLIRFQDVGGTYYAPFEPNCDVLPLLARHFCRRLTDNWVLHDVKRGRAALHREGRWVMTKAAFPAQITETKEERFCQELWKEFFRNVSIEERKNVELQKKFLPLRVRKHLTECLK